MLETILKYLSVITVAGAAISFIVGLIKYLDQPRPEERTMRFKMFHDLMKEVPDMNNRRLPRGPARFFPHCNTAGPQRCSR
jgi:hypothetical protein